MSFICERCHHDGKNKYNLLIHLRSKNPCPTTYSMGSREHIIGKLTKKELTDSSVICEACDKVIHKAGIARHRKVCKGSKKDKASEYEEMKQVMAHMQKKIEDLETRLNSQTNAMVNNNNNNTINNNNTQNNIGNQQNINITINNFGEESTQHLTPEFLRNCILNPTREFKNLITEIHYNPDVPENHNLRFKSSKRNTFEKFITPGWQECDATNTLDELIRKGYKVLNAHYMEHVMNDPQIQDNETTMRMYERFRILSDKQSQEYNAVKRDLRVLVKDRTAFVLAAPDTHLDQHDIETLAQEVVNTV